MFLREAAPDGAHVEAERRAGVETDHALRGVRAPRLSPRGLSPGNLSGIEWIDGFSHRLKYKRFKFEMQCRVSVYKVTSGPNRQKSSMPAPSRATSSLLLVGVIFCMIVQNTYPTTKEA